MFPLSSAYNCNTLQNIPAFVLGSTQMCCVVSALQYTGVTFISTCQPSASRRILFRPSDHTGCSHLQPLYIHTFVVCMSSVGFSLSMPDCTLSSEFYYSFWTHPWRSRLGTIGIIALNLLGIIELIYCPSVYAAVPSVWCVRKSYYSWLITRVLPAGRYDKTYQIWYFCLGGDCHPRTMPNPWCITSEFDTD